MNSLNNRISTAMVDWSNYAQVYDLILNYNQAYQSILEIFEQTVSQWQLPVGTEVLDVGAGTGNFGLFFAERFPQSRVTLLDNDSGMLSVAKGKMESRGLKNVVMVRADASNLQAALPGKKFGVVIAVHSLYTLPQPGTIESIRQLLIPQALGFFCDVGRVLQIADWASWLFSTIRERHGFATACKFFWNGRDIAKENRRIRRLQQEGTYWIHSLEEFIAALSLSGFDVQHAGLTFRGYSDFAEVRAK